MINPKNEVLFSEYCKTCKHKLCDCEDEPCCDCLAESVNFYSHKPVKWEGVDTLFNKPVERRNHEVERAVKDAIYLNAKDTAKVIDKQGTLAGKVHMRDLISCAVNCISESCDPAPTYTYGEMENLLTMILTGKFKSDAKVITKDILKGYRGYEYADTPNAEEIGEYAFATSTSLNSLNMPNVKRIKYKAFTGCNALYELDSGAISNLEYIDDEAFNHCTVLTNNIVSHGGPELMNFVKLKELGSSAFLDTNIYKISLPILTEIKHQTFYRCKQLYYLSAPNVTKIGYQAFSGCQTLTSIDLRNATEINSGAFSGCQNLNINFSSDDGAPRHISKMGDHAFEGCYSLEAFHSDIITKIPDYAFDECITLSHVLLGGPVTHIGMCAFANCYKLTYLGLLAVESVPTLGNDAFAKVDFDNFDIVVPKSLYYSFIHSNVWGVFRKCIMPSEPCSYMTFKCINNGCIRYPDDNISNYQLIREFYPTIEGAPPIGIRSYEIIPDEGYKIGLLTVNGVDHTDSIRTVTTDIRRVEVTQLDNVRYGFEKDSSGWWVSQNKGANSSYAICRVKFDFDQSTTVTFSIVNYAEANFDYGMIGTVDNALPTNNGETGSTTWNGKTLNSSSVQTHTINVTAGKHFVDVKYRKDGSQHSNNDCLKFKVTSSNANEVARQEFNYFYDVNPSSPNGNAIISFVKIEETEST